MLVVVGIHGLDLSILLPVYDRQIQLAMLTWNLADIGCIGILGATTIIS